MVALDLWHHSRDWLSGHKWLEFALVKYISSSLLKDSFSGCIILVGNYLLSGLEMHHSPFPDFRLLLAERFRIILMGWSLLFFFLGHASLESKYPCIWKLGGKSQCSKIALWSNSWERELAFLWLLILHSNSVAVLFSRFLCGHIKIVLKNRRFHELRL